MTVWSMTPLLNELDLLEVRLRELDDVVDVHVVAESPFTFAGGHKPLHYADNLERFAPWVDKIRYVVTDRMRTPRQTFGDPDRWARENGQRDALGDALAGMEPDDIVVLSDVDEIPRRDTILEYAELGEQRMLKPPLPMLLYKAGWRVVEPQASVLVLFRGRQIVGTPDQPYGMSVEEIRHMPPAAWPGTTHGVTPHDDATQYGWHLSYCGGVAAVQYKVRQAAHPEEALDDWLEPAYLEDCIRLGKDHRKNRAHKLVACESDEWPDAIDADEARFASLIDPLLYPVPAVLLSDV